MDVMEHEIQTPSEMGDFITDALFTYSPHPNGEVVNVSTFADEGLLTRNEGLIVRMADGSEFQLTIVRSR